VKFAYADPPYLGYSKKFYADQHSNAAAYDTLDAHSALIERLCDEYPDGWALSMTSGNLHDILPLCPKDCRIGAWVKPFCSFKLHVGVAYAWEPVVFRGGRKHQIHEPTVRDWCSVNLTLKRGFPTAKPAGLIWWILELLNAKPEDELDDLFPGSGSVTRAVEGWKEASTGRFQHGLFETVQ
jgi:hypothetical protein